MRFTAFVPPPPTPTTLMTAKCSEPGMFGISSSTPVAFYCCVCLVSARRCSGAPCAVRPKAAFMQDIVHDAHSFATQITAKGACRYTNTTRNPPHRASQGRQSGSLGRGFFAGLGSDASPRIQVSRFLGNSSVGEGVPFLQQIASYKRLRCGREGPQKFPYLQNPRSRALAAGVSKSSAPPRRL